MPAEFDMTCFIITTDDLIVRALRLLRLIGVNFGNKGKRFLSSSFTVMPYFVALLGMFVIVIQQK